MPMMQGLPPWEVALLMRVSSDGGAPGYVLSLDAKDREHARWALPSIAGYGDFEPIVAAQTIFRQIVGLSASTARLCHQGQCEHDGVTHYLFSTTISPALCRFVERRVANGASEPSKFFDEAQFADLVKSNKFRREQYEALLERKLIAA